MAQKLERIDNIERLDIMEEKFGVVLEGLNAQMFFYHGEDILPEIIVYGEIHAANGTGIEENIFIVATAFDHDGKVIGNSSQYLAKGEFFALHSLNITISNVLSKPFKIRIYPEKL